MATAAQTLPAAVSLAKLAEYKTLVDICICKSFYFGSRRDANFVCKHMHAARTIAAAEASLAAAYRCRHCGVDAAAPGRVFCAPCAFVLAQFAAQGCNDQTWESTAHCVACGAEYFYSDASPLYCSESCAVVAEKVA